MRLSAHDLHRPKSQRFNVELSNFEIAGKYPIKVFPHHFKAEILEAKNLTDEGSTLMPANITAVVHPAGQESFWVDILEQSATDPAKFRSDRFKKIDAKNQGETPRSESRIRPKDT
jgi:hypothetical protein